MGRRPSWYKWSPFKCTYTFACDNGGLVIPAPEVQNSGLLEFIDLPDQATWSPPCQGETL